MAELMRQSIGGEISVNTYGATARMDDLIAAIDHSTDLRKDLLLKAAGMEADAVVMRSQAETRLRNSQREAVRMLTEMYEAGQLTADETMRYLVEFESRQPHFGEDDHFDAGRILANFSHMKLEAPIVDIDGKRAGLISKEPRIEIANGHDPRFTSPQATILYGLEKFRRMDHTDMLVAREKVRTPLAELGGIAVGVDSIQQMLDKQAFVISERDGSVTSNATEIAALRKHITDLYSLGIRDFDTTQLDRAVKEASDEFPSIMRRRVENQLQGIRRPVERMVERVSDEIAPHIRTIRQTSPRDALSQIEAFRTRMRERT